MGTITTKDFFNSGEDINGSYRNIIRSKKNLSDQARQIATKNGYSPATRDTLQKFLRLKQKDSYSSAPVSAKVASDQSGGAGWSDQLLDSEAAALLQEIQSQASLEFIKNFYNSYMAPIQSDIVYRLGKVTRKKKFGTAIYNSDGNAVETTNQNTCNILGQTDKFGRMDTVSNLRTRIDIDPCVITHRGQKVVITPGLSEYYVNYFFPPYSTSTFDYELLQKVEEIKLARSKKKADEKVSVEGLDAMNHADNVMRNAEMTSIQTKSIAALEDPALTATYDYIEMMCARDGFTYRAPAFKAVNDNINFLQYIFEQCTGIVSTYLTEWDLSLYMQEGLFSTTKGSTIWLCNRLLEDNPQGLTGDNANTWGVLNSAVSKLAIGSGVSSNHKIWDPRMYYQSAYWWPYSYAPRGDGLPEFYDYTVRGPNSERNAALCSSFRGRLKYDDEVHMAFAGWTRADVFQYYQALYTTPDDGMSSVDRVYLNEPFPTLVEELEAVQDALKEDNEEFEWQDDSLKNVINFEEPREFTYIPGVYYNKKVEYYELTNPHDSGTKTLKYVECFMNDKYIAREDAHGNEMTAPLNDINMDDEGNISVLGVEIKGSKLLKLFLKKDQTKANAMSIADKTKSGFSDLTCYTDGSGGLDTSGQPSPLVEALNNNPDENKHYSNSTGIPRLGPVLFGGPHGSSYSPNTMQAYFDPNNAFLRSIARIEPSILYDTGNFDSGDRNSYYKGVERQYSIPMGRGGDRVSMGRSPSETLHILKKGFCETVPTYVWMKKRHYRYIRMNPYVTTYRRWWLGRLRISLHYSSTEYVSGEPVYYDWNASEYYSNSYSWVDTGVNWWDAIWGWIDTGSYSASFSWGRLYIYVQDKLRFGSYEEFSLQIYNKPLMHNISTFDSNPNRCRWRLGKYRWAPNVGGKVLSSGKYAQYLKSFGGDKELQRCAAYYTLKKLNINKDFYRLTMPFADANYTSNSHSVRIDWTEQIGSPTESKPEVHVSWTDRYYPEEDVVTYMLGNAGSPSHGSNIFYCVSNNSDSLSERMTKGPRAVVQIPTRLVTETVSYFELGSTRKKHSGTCHSDTWYYTIPRSKSYSWIRADLDNSKAFFGSANWHPIYRPNLMAADIMTEMPGDEYRMETYYASPLQMLSNGSTSSSANRSFRFAGPGYDTQQFDYITGWGLFQALPGMDPDFGSQASFEDANEYLNLGKIYNDYGMGSIYNTKLKDIALFSTKLSPYAPKRRRDGYLVVENGTKIYDRVLLGLPEDGNLRNTFIRKFGSKVIDQGLYNFMIKMYSSCMLFIPDSKNKANNFQPFATDVGACVICALKLIQHQKAYLKFGKELFENTIEPQEVIYILDKSVDKSITNASYYNKNPDSCYYNYWIERAYMLYGEYTKEVDKDGNPIKSHKETLIAAFDNRIAKINNFIDECEEFLDKIDNISARKQWNSAEWTFNNFIDCYKLFDAFKYSIEEIKNDSSIEEFFYSYLNVLYEYRRYFINKRCNKQDGTLWICRQFESVIPFMKALGNGEGPDGDSPLVSTSSPDVNVYHVAFKEVSNSIEDKGRALASGEKLTEDKIIKLYIPTKKVGEKEFRNFIEGKSNEPVLKVRKTDPLNKNNSFVIYIKKPEDGTYMLQSKESAENDVAKANLDKLDSLLKAKSITPVDYNIKSKALNVNPNIDECIFPIAWFVSSADAKLNAYINASKLLNKAEDAQQKILKDYETSQQEYVDMIANHKEVEEVKDREYLGAKDSFEYHNKIIEEGEAYTYFYDKETLKETEYFEQLRLCAEDPEHKAGEFSEEIYESLAEPEFDEDGNKLPVNQEPFRSHSEYIWENTLVYKKSCEAFKPAKDLLDRRLTEKETLEKQNKEEEEAQQKLIKENRKDYALKTQAYNKAVEDEKTAYTIYKGSQKKKTVRNENDYTWFPPTQPSSDTPNTLVPTIEFNIPSGINPRKVAEVGDPKTVDPKEAICRGSDFKDYWCVSIPVEECPRNIGYDTALKIKTFETDVRNAIEFTADRLTTIAGPFAYSLYPITEEQSGIIASVGADIGGLAETLKHKLS